MAESSPTLRVFVSYARRDGSAFAEELLAGLEVAGFDPFLDRHDIAAGEDWEARLEALIKASDTVVFVITPASVASERCSWEVAKAEALSKRIIPVVLTDVPEEVIPARLKRLNYIYFTEGKSFARSLADLAKALRIDLDWIREHTRLAELATRWRDRDRADVLLLRGSELDAAKTWLLAWKAGAPEPSDAHRALISESEAAELTRNSAERKRLEEMAAAQNSKQEALNRLSRRTTFGLFGAGGLTAAAAGLAYWGNDAERRFRQKQDELTKAEELQKVRDAEAEARSLKNSILKEAMRTDIVGQIVAYAASPGEFASDGDPGSNSPYTLAVLSELNNPDRSLLSGLMSAHATVTRVSEQMQRPYVSTDMSGDVYMLQQPEVRRRRAFCISVDGFDGSPKFLNVERDAIAWEIYLKRCRFEVTRLVNPTIDEIQRAVQLFRFEKKPVEHGYLRGDRTSARIEKVGLVPVPHQPEPNTFVVLFFSGMGFSRDGQEFLSGSDSFIKQTITPRTGSEERPITYDVRNAFALGGLLKHLRQEFELSAAILDTNFFNADDSVESAAPTNRTTR